MGVVVDERLRVEDVKRLRVVDASAFPYHISGNIMGKYSCGGGESGGYD